MNKQATPLIQAKLTLPFEQADEVSDLLMELGALAVSLEDANADSEDEQPLFGEPGMEPESAAWNLNHVVALFRNKAEGEQIFGEIPGDLLGNIEIDYTEVPQEDWVRLTQSQFDPIQISARLWIVPCHRMVLWVPGSVRAAGRKARPSGRSPASPDWRTGYVSRL